MLRIPDQPVESGAHPAVVVPEATVIGYVGRPGLEAAQVLVQRPTFVWIRSGVKLLQPQGAESTLMGPAGALVAMRSGTHVMTELQADDQDYASVILSVDRTFLREVSGSPQSTPKPGPSVVISHPVASVPTPFAGLPDRLRRSPSEVERQFALRELLVGLMHDERVRELVFREVVDWGHTVEERVQGVMGRHCLTPLQTSDFASLCGMSLSTFKRHFKRIYGVAPAAWLTQTRLRHARTLLLHSDRSVGEVGEATGYRDVSTFIRAFRRAYGTTPAAFRR